MGFGSFITHLVAPVLKTVAPIVKNPIVQALQPEIAVPLSLATGGGVFGFGAQKQTSVQPPAAGNVLQPQGQSFYYAAPQYQPPMYPQFSYPQYGGSPWDYSTQLTPSFQEPYPTYRAAYSPPQTPPIWEDLASLVPLFL